MNIAFYIAAVVVVWLVLDLIFIVWWAMMHR